MKTPNVSRAIKLCGTEQPDVVGQVLRAGPLTVEFDNGALRYLRVDRILGEYRKSRSVAS